jgi:hypothetical protein
MALVLLQPGNARAACPLPSCDVRCADSVDRDAHASTNCSPGGPFFEEVRALAPGREVWTTVQDDRRLPAMNFYLDRPLRILELPEDVMGLMRSGRRVGVLR